MGYHLVCSLPKAGSFIQKKKNNLNRHLSSMFLKNHMTEILQLPLVIFSSASLSLPLRKLQIFSVL